MVRSLADRAFQPRLKAQHAAAVERAAAKQAEKEIETALRQADELKGDWVTGLRQKGDWL